LDVIAAIGLAIGGVFGLAGTIVDQEVRISVIVITQIGRS
jgi:hypothetical protein